MPTVCPQIQDECLADDVPIPDEATAWIEPECRAYFESGGRELPQIMAGFEGAEIHAHYELQQKRMESADTDDMLDALSAALFKTTGEAQFKPAEKPEFKPEEHYGSMKREKCATYMSSAIRELHLMLRDWLVMAGMSQR